MTASAAEQHEEHQLARTRALLLFYLLAFGISWLGYVPLLAGSHGVRYFQGRCWLGLLILPGIGPALAAAIAGSWAQHPGKDGAGGLVPLGRSFTRKVPGQMWALSVLLSVAIMLIASVATVFFQSSHTPLIRSFTTANVALFSLLSVLANPLEEVGWRGFAQNRLQDKYSALTAACIVGVLWAVWHVPLFLLTGGPMSMAETPFWAWSAGVIPQAVILAWLYNRTGRGLAAVSVFHVVGNISGMIFNSSAISVSVTRFAVALILVCMSGPNLGLRIVRVKD